MFVVGAIAGLAGWPADRAWIWICCDLEHGHWYRVGASSASGCSGNALLPFCRFIGSIVNATIGAVILLIIVVYPALARPVLRSRSDRTHFSRASARGRAPSARPQAVWRPRR
jgi:hypothetical protein